MKRMHIRLTTSEDVVNFIQGLNEGNKNDTYALMDESLKYHVDARSLMGVMYMMTEYTNCYLINETHDGEFPVSVECFNI